MLSYKELMALASKKVVDNEHGRVGAFHAPPLKPHLCAAATPPNRRCAATTTPRRRSPGVPHDPGLAAPSTAPRIQDIGRESKDCSDEREMRRLKFRRLKEETSRLERERRAEKARPAMTANAGGGASTSGAGSSGALKVMGT